MSIVLAARLGPSRDAAKSPLLLWQRLLDNCKPYASVALKSTILRSSFRDFRRGTRRSKVTVQNDF